MTDSLVKESATDDEINQKAETETETSRRKKRIYDDKISSETIILSSSSVRIFCLGATNYLSLTN